MTAALLIIGGLTIACSVGLGIRTTQHMQTEVTQQSVDKLAASLKGTAVEGWTYKDVVGQLYDMGKITKSDYNDFVNVLDEINASELTIGQALAQDGSVNSITNGRRLDDLLKRLMKDTPELLDSYKTLTSMSDEELAGAFASPAINVPTPAYFSNNVKGERFEVHEPRLLSGQEMADLHGINYDPEHYYDLIKQGTQANVELGKFTSDQLRNQSNWTDQADIASYLDSVQNAKSSAIAKGSTAGARAAAELLAGRQNAQAKFQNTATVADQRFQAVDDYLNADASARLTATNYFNTLAQRLSTDAASYYTNDVEDYVADLTANANMAAADWNLWGNYQYANGMMAGDYARNQAAADGYNKMSNEYNDVFNINYRANLEQGMSRDAAIATAWKTTEDYILAGNTKGAYSNYYDYAKQNMNEYKTPTNWFSYGQDYLKRNPTAPRSLGM